MGYFKNLSVAVLYSVEWKDDRWFGRDVEGSGRVLNTCPEELGKTKKIISRNSQCPGRDSKGACPEYWLK
jgi:hypothetical protein